MRRWWQARGVLFNTAVLFAAVLVGLDLVFPWAAKWIAGSPNPLPAPRTLRLWYLILVAGSLAIYVISSDELSRSFVEPIRRAASGSSSRSERWIYLACLVLLPVGAGAVAFSRLAPRAEVPSATRQQHPGMASAGAAPYADKQNPLREPTAELLAAFRDRYAAEPGPEDEYDSRPKKADVARLGPAELRQLFDAQNLNQGRALYFKNCAPCHGAKFDGDGPAARAWSLRPIDFRDAGTIATLVEDAVFWRVNEGGVGLPPVATPWDSAMPRWKADLTEEEIWKIIVAEYHDAGVKPRVLEFRLEGQTGEAKQ